MKKEKVSLAIFISFCFGVGVVIGFLFSWNLAKERFFNQGYLEGSKEMEKRYQAKIQEVFPQPEKIFTLIGKIINLEEEKKILTLRASLQTPNPFAPKLEKKVKVGEDTKIVKRTIKSIEEFQKETEKGSSPLPYREELGEFSDLKIGEQIIVEASENIKNKEEFVAERIIIQFPKEE